jgi:hypothetical protein
MKNSRETALKKSEEDRERASGNVYGVTGEQPPCHAILYPDYP